VAKCAAAQPFVAGATALTGRGLNSNVSRAEFGSGIKAYTLHLLCSGERCLVVVKSESSQIASFRWVRLRDLPSIRLQPPGASTGFRLDIGYAQSQFKPGALHQVSVPLVWSLKQN